MRAETFNYLLRFKFPSFLRLKRFFPTSNCYLFCWFWAFSTTFRLHIGYKMSAHACAQLMVCTKMHFININNMWKKSAVHIPVLTPNFIFFSKTLQFLGHFSSLLPHKNVHISAHRHNRYMLWAFIFLVLEHKLSIGTHLFWSIEIFC